MNRVDIGTIDFSKLQQLNTKQHFESFLFHDDKLLYKVFKNMPRYKLERKQQKIELLSDGVPLPITVMPKIECFDKELFVAYAMVYLKQCITLFDIKTRSKFIQDFFNIVFKVSEEVVAIIAGLATTEVEGVSSMAGNITNEIVSKLGMKNLSKGIFVEVLEGEIKVDVAINIEYGYAIPEISTKVQERVKSAVENMTGLTVAVVNIRIASVDMGDN